VWLWPNELQEPGDAPQKGSGHGKVWKNEQRAKTPKLGKRSYVFLHCTSIQWDLSIYKVSWWYQSYVPGKIQSAKINKGQ
jgi:hypothetical protein